MELTYVQHWADTVSCESANIKLGVVGGVLLGGRRPDADLGCVLVFPLFQRHVCGLPVVHTQCLVLHWAGHPEAKQKCSGTGFFTERPGGRKCILAALPRPLRISLGGRFLLELARARQPCRTGWRGGAVVVVSQVGGLGVATLAEGEGRQSSGG